VGYVMDIKEVGSNKELSEDLFRRLSEDNKLSVIDKEIACDNNISSELIVRPYLHAPEIDPYDEISLEQVEGIYDDKNYLDIGSKIIYRL
jgi:hypothetical protein